MAARKNKGTHNQKWDEQTRQKIQTSMLLNRLLKHCLTHPGKEEFEKDFMDKSQVAAALGLMKKVLPDLSAITHKGDEENPFLIKDISAKPLEQKADKWLEQIKDKEVIDHDDIN